MPKKPAELLLIAFLLLLYLGPLFFWGSQVFSREERLIPQGLPFWSLLGRTILFSLFSSFGSIVFAYPLLLLWLVSGALIRKALFSLLVVPLVMGLLARNYSWIGMLSATTAFSSMGGSYLGLTEVLYTPTAVVCVMACVFLPMSFFILLQGVTTIHLDQVEAARTLGLPDWRIVFKIILPLTYRAALLAFGFAFALAVGFFVTPRMVGGGKFDLMGNAILMYVNIGRFDAASSVASLFLVLLTVPLFLILLYALLRRIRVVGR
jgi:ABC-type spermidine/putrescine transport system permease subunit I